MSCRALLTLSSSREEILRSLQWPASTRHRAGQSDKTGLQGFMTRRRGERDEQRSVSGDLFKEISGGRAALEENENAARSSALRRTG